MHSCKTDMGYNQDFSLPLKKSFTEPNEQPCNCLRNG